MYRMSMLKMYGVYSTRSKVKYEVKGESGRIMPGASRLVSGIIHGHRRVTSDVQATSSVYV